MLAPLKKGATSYSFPMWMESLGFWFLDISIMGCVTSLLAVSKGSPKSRIQIRIFLGRAASKLEANRVLLVTHFRADSGNLHWETVVGSGDHSESNTFRVNFGIQLGFGTFERAFLISSLLFPLG